MRERASAPAYSLQRLLIWGIKVSPATFSELNKKACVPSGTVCLTHFCG